MADTDVAVRRTSNRLGRGKPTRENVEFVYTMLTQHYQTDNQELKTLRDIREQKFIVEVPKRLKRVEGFYLHDTSVADEIRRIVSSVNSRPWKCIVTASDPQSDTGQRLQELLERATEQIFIEAGQRVNGQNTQEQNTDACFGDGAAWSKLVYDKHIWQSVIHMPDTVDEWLGEDKVTRKKDDQEYLKDREDAKKGVGVPIVDKNVDAACCFPLWSGDELVAMLEVTERPVFELLDNYPKAQGPSTRIYGQGVNQDEAARYGQTARFAELWTKEWVVYTIIWGAGNDDTEVVLSIKHGYGEVPYFFAPGYVNSYWRGRKKGDSIAQVWADLTVKRMFLEQLIVNIAAQVAGTPIQHIRPESGAEPLIADADMPEGEIKWFELAGIYEGAPGERWETIPLPSLPDVLKDLLTIINNRIEKLQIPRINAIGTDMSGAGFAYAQILAEIKVSYDVYVKHLEQMMVRKTRFLWKLIRDHIGETVYVNYTPVTKSGRAGSEWLALSPSDLKDNVGLAWKIDSDPPTAEIVKARYVGERMQQGTMSPDMAIEFLGDNPAEVRRGILIAQLRNEPEFKQLQKEQILQELDRGDLLKKAAVMAAQSGLAPGLPPEIMQQMLMQTMQGGPGAPMGGGGGAGGMPQMPDQSALMATPNGAGVAPQGMGEAYAGAGGPPGAMMGAPQVQGPPMRSAAAGIQAMR